jgi:hypothetical protein
MTDQQPASYVQKDGELYSLALRPLLPDEASYPDDRP